MIKGITLSVVASILFGAMYYFTSTLTPLNGEQVYGWRTLLTLPFLTLFMALSGDWRKVGDTLAWIGQRPQRLLGLLLTSALLGSAAVAVPVGAAARQGARRVARLFSAAADHGAGGPFDLPRSAVAAAKAGGGVRHGRGGQ